MGQKQIINEFLVDVFNLILRKESASLRDHANGNLSISEYHVIESIYNNTEHNTMGEIAKILSITIGSLTVAIATLEKKGYVEKYKDSKDKRSVRVRCTESGLEVNEFHKNFHDNMMEELSASLTEDQLDVMVDALIALKKYFYKEK